jgi:putative transposase
MIVLEPIELSVRCQCELLGVNRSRLYYQALEARLDDVMLLNEIRDIWMRRPFYGYRRITKELQAMGHAVNRKRVQRLMQLGGIEALYAKPKTSLKNKAHAVHPYLLKGLQIERPNQAWQVDITYLRMQNGFMYLTAIIDVYSRYVVGWSLSNTLDTQSCLDALTMSLTHVKPDIVNSDQGCQFTSEGWVNALKEAAIKISMTGKGRCLDNIYIERFWRSFKQEEFYLHDYETVSQLKRAIKAYIEFYNHERWHQSLNYKRPVDLYFNRVKKREAVDIMDNTTSYPQVLTASIC